MFTTRRCDQVEKGGSRGTAVVAAVACGRPAVRSTLGRPGGSVRQLAGNPSHPRFLTTQPPGSELTHSRALAHSRHTVGSVYVAWLSPPRLSVYLYWREISRAGIAIELQLTGECNRYSARLFSGSFATNKSPGEVPRRKLERRGCECCRRHGGCFCRLGLSGGQTRRTLTFFYSLSRSLLSASKWST